MIGNPDDMDQFVFEVSWEVANKVGGIYTVLKTKASAMIEQLGSQYMLVGPLSAQCLREVEPCADRGAMEEPLRQMDELEIPYVYGTWLIEDCPKVILLDTTKYRDRAGRIFREYLDCIPAEVNMSDVETVDALLFGYTVSKFLQIVPLANHFAAGILFMKKDSPAIPTVFTSHATILGRHLCAGNKDFYNHIKEIDIDYEAGSRGIYLKYCIERAIAHTSDVFTCVSHITAFESECLLKRKPDGVLPNGLRVLLPAELQNFQHVHETNKGRILDFVRGHFCGHLDFDLEQTLVFFIAGRREYRNKGVDIFIESLQRLNVFLKQCNSTITVVVFIIMPGSVNNYNVDTLNRQAIVRQLKDVVSDIGRDVEKRLLDNTLHGIVPSADILTTDEITRFKRFILALSLKELPPIVTHNVNDAHSDPVLQELRRTNLINKSEDRVKVVYHPEFLTSSSPVLPMEYEDFIRGCHLGIFPSYYEPWGYTPAECTVFGIPSVSSNLSGFGCFVEEAVEVPSEHGIYVIDRRRKSVEESVQQLFQVMCSFCQKTKRQRYVLRNRTIKMSALLDWNNLIVDYVKAQNLACQRKQGNVHHDSGIRLNSPKLKYCPNSPAS